MAPRATSHVVVLSIFADGICVRQGLYWELDIIINNAGWRRASSVTLRLLLVIVPDVEFLRRGRFFICSGYD
jgi:hypothetical protein